MIGATPAFAKKLPWQGGAQLFEDPLPMVILGERGERSQSLFKFVGAVAFRLLHFWQYQFWMCHCVQTCF